MTSEVRFSRQKTERVQPLKVVWFSFFPIERLPDLPAELANLPRIHPASWQRVLWDQFKENTQLSLDIIVLRSHFRRDLIFERGNTRFHCIKTPGGLRTGSLYWLDTWLIRRKVQQLKPDLLHAWGTEFGAGSVAARLKGLNYPTLLTMHGILSWIATVSPLNNHQKVARFFEKRSLQRAKLVTAESSFSMNYLQTHYPHLRLLQVEHAPNPIFSRLERQPTSGPARILAVGAFSHVKGADVAIEALDGLVRTHDFQLLWIGAPEPEFLTLVQQRASPELWKRIVFKHDLTPEEIGREFERATMLIHASRADNSPNSVKEAVVAGVPVIASKIGGIPDYVFPERNGLLFTCGDVADCRARIKQALKHPIFSKGEVEAETLARVREYLSATRMSSNFLNAYETTLETYGPRS